MSTAFHVKHDPSGDVLYALREGSSVYRSRGAPADAYLIINRDLSGNIVGIQLMAASEMPSRIWLEHPDRSELPTDLLVALDGWFNNRG